MKNHYHLLKKTVKKIWYVTIKINMMAAINCLGVNSTNCMILVTLNLAVKGKKSNPDDLSDICQLFDSSLSGI